MIEGKTSLDTSISSVQARRRYLVASLAELFPGFTATVDLFGSSIGTDTLDGSLFGPLGDAGVALRVHDGPSGPYVEGLDLLIAIARVLRVGPPVWSRNLNEQADYWKGQIAQCEPFQVPEPAPRSRAEMEDHIERCATCQPVSHAMAAEINAGSSAYQDADLADMIERSHLNQGEAISHYRQRAAAHSMHAAPSSVKRVRKAEVTA